LPHIVEGYKEEDSCILNLDETGCFWTALPEVSLGQKAKQCKGGANAARGKESLPIFLLYYNQSKSWMTGDILCDVLSKVNARLKRKGRSVLLLMDNAGCHPSDLKDKFSNISVVFLPANTTSKLQPLDLGVIMNFKVYYRKLLMQFVLARMLFCNRSSKVCHHHPSYSMDCPGMGLSEPRSGTEVLQKCWHP